MKHTICSGVCADLTSDSANCGGCGTACAVSEMCSNSQCVTSATEYRDGFETSFPGNDWTVIATNSGRVRRLTTNNPRTGGYHLVMDAPRSTGSTYSLNSATICLDLSVATNLNLSVWAKEFGDELDGNDGIYISGTGTSYDKVVTFPSDFSSYQEFTLDLDVALAANQITDKSTVFIRLQQYDNRSVTTDGIAFDDFAVTGNGLITVCP